MVDEDIGIYEDRRAIFQIGKEHDQASSGRNSGESAISSMVLPSRPLNIPLVALTTLSSSRVILTLLCSFRFNGNKGFKTPKGLFVLPTGRTVSLEGCAAVRIFPSSMGNPDWKRLGLFF